MITTVTLNPSIDIAYTIEELNLDKVNRVETVNKTAGGKGVNVARVLNLLGEEVIATGLIGGQHGEYLKNQLDQLGIMRISLFQLKERQEILLLSCMVRDKQSFWNEALS